MCYINYLRFFQRKDNWIHCMKQVFNFRFVKFEIGLFTLKPEASRYKPYLQEY